MARTSSTASCKALILAISISEGVVDVVDEVEVGLDMGDEVEVEVVDDGGFGEDLVGNGFEGSKHLASTPPSSKQYSSPG